MRNGPITLLLLAAIPLASFSQALADDEGPATPDRSSRSAKPNKTDKSAARRAVLDEAARTRALTFAEEHHPELATLLQRLRTHDEREFGKALREIAAVADRLAKLRDRDPARHALQLELWRIDSRVQLLAARLSMGDDEELERRLRELVAQRVELRLRVLRAERDNLEKRIANTNATIEKIESNPEAVVNRELKRIHATIGNAPKNERPATRPVKSRAVD